MFESFGLLEFNRNYTIDIQSLPKPIMGDDKANGRRSFITKAVATPPDPSMIYISSQLLLDSMPSLEVDHLQTTLKVARSLVATPNASLSSVIFSYFFWDPAIEYTVTLLCCQLASGRWPNGNNVALKNWLAAILLLSHLCTYCN